MLLGLMAAGGSGCVLDSSDRCGPNQIIAPDTEMERCVCAPNAALVGTACILCGENEVPGGAGCACAPGFARGTDGACAPVPAGLGVACSASMPCTDATFNHCATSANGQGYCTTTGCTSNDDCTNGYACEPGATPYCRRPPVGGGMSCTSNNDCAGTEATFCDTLFQHACIVEGCQVSPNNCFSGTVCCNVGLPMPICIPGTACTQ
jgi:hypothetical protein